MDRRAFFKRALHKAGETIVEEAAKRIAATPVTWVRPPYAQEEFSFIVACTSCGDCIKACSYGVIFPLPAGKGLQVAGTPALDLLSKGCHLCDDWPCVASCATGALKLPDVDEGQVRALPMLAVASINTETCLPYMGPECGACASSCPVPGALRWEQCRPSIDAALCVGCALCREVCIVQPSAVQIRLRSVVVNSDSEQKSDAV